MSATQARQEATEFWRQFEVTVAYDKPWKLRGVVDALRQTKNTAGDWVPRLAIIGELIEPDGKFTGRNVLLVVTANPSRLRSELVLADPAIGDKIWIEYLGPDPKAPPGLNPTKRFRVVVKAPGTPVLPDTGEAFGEVGPDGAGAGPGTT